MSEGRAFLDDAFANAAYIDNADEIVAGWEARSAQFRDEFRSEVIKTGPAPRQFCDLYQIDKTPRGLTIVVHGGYWQAFSGRDFAHLCRGALERGDAVASVTYTLAPEARIAEITNELVRAIKCLAPRSRGPIRLVGHSAGGHLVTRMMCEGVLPEEIASRIQQVVSVSGLHDLRPLIETSMNKLLRLDPEEASRESSVLLTPIGSTPLICVAGSDERPEFLRQNKLLPLVWSGLGVNAHALELAGHNHFSIISELEHGEGALTRLLFGDQSGLLRA